VCDRGVEQTDPRRKARIEVVHDPFDARVLGSCFVDESLASIDADDLRSALLVLVGQPSVSAAHIEYSLPGRRRDRGPKSWPRAAEEGVLGLANGIGVHVGDRVPMTDVFRAAHSSNAIPEQEPPLEVPADGAVYGQSVGICRSTMRLKVCDMVHRRPFPLLAERPAALEGVVLDFHWDLERLHSLSLPEQDVPTADLKWHLELPFWAAGGIPFQVSPADVAAEPSKHADQWRRTITADLACPLDTYVAVSGRFIILDGIHRLLKAVMEGRATLRVRVLHPEAFDDIAVPA